MTTIKSTVTPSLPHVTGESLTAAGKPQIKTPGQVQVPAAPMDATAVAGKSFEAGHTPIITHSPDGTPLLNGKAVAPEVLAQLQSLTNLAGAIKGELGQSGDVDINVTGTFTVALPDAKSLGQTHGALTTVFSGENTTLQSGAIDVLKGHTAALSVAQDKLGAEAFQGSFLMIKTELVHISAAVVAGGINGAAQSGPHFEKALAGLDKLPVDPGAYVQWVLRESYLETTNELVDFAEKVKFYNELKKDIRAELKGAREKMASLAGMADDAWEGDALNPKEFDATFTGGPSEGGTGTLTPEELKAHNDKLKLQGAYETYQINLETNTATKPVTIDPPPPPFPPAGAVPNVPWGNAYLKISADEAGRQYGQSLAAWYRGLDPDEKQAVALHLKEDGLIMGGDASEYHSGKSTPVQVNDFTTGRMSGNDVEAYLTQAGASIGSEIHRRAQSVDGTKPYDCRLWVANFPNAIEVPDPAAVPVPPEIANFPGGIEGVKRELGIRAAAEGAWSSGQAIDSKADLDAYMKNLEDQLSSVGDDAQLANVDLQNVLQKQQQTIQQISNISKMLHDTAMAIVRKIGG